MTYSINETGNTYGRLRVLSKAEDKRNGAYWLCECSCGKQIIARGSTLRQGHYQSCGCLRSEPIPEQQSLKNQILGSMKYGAKSRGLSWELTDTHALELAFQNCFYCGSSPENNMRGELHYNGIDRVDNTKGYVLGNVVSCCKTCNMAKNKTPAKEFLEWVKQVYQHSFLEKKDGL